MKYEKIPNSYEIGGQLQYNSFRRYYLSGMEIRRKDKHPDHSWKLCGSDEDYGLFRTKSPKDVAIFLIHCAFTEDEIAKRKFVYVPHTYRGLNGMKDTIDVYYKMYHGFSIEAK